jgi:hypothetical protein
VSVVKRLVGSLFVATALAVIPMAGVGVAHADVCGSVNGPNGEVNGCTNGVPGVGALEGVVVADAIDEARQRAAGRPPCYTRYGVPYYTPGDAPCL